MDTKICSKCKIEKSINEFGKDSFRKDGLNWQCKKCYKEYLQRPEVRERMKKYNQSPKVKKWAKQYIHTPKGIYSIIHRRARRKNLPCCGKEEFVNWYNNQEKKCIYCDIPEGLISKLEWGLKNKQNRLEIDKKCSNKGYTIGNMCLSCRRCNAIKSNFLTFKEMKEIGQKYIKPKWQG